MTLDDFRTYIRAYVPGAKTTVVTPEFLDLLINFGVKEINLFAKAYKDDAKFDVEADKQKYTILDELPNYALIGDSGIWWNAGSASSPDWRQLDALDYNALDKQFPRWRDDTGDDPRRYVLTKESLIIHPYPNTGLSDGFWAYFTKQPTDMTSGDHFPFTGSTTEIKSLSVLDDAIIDYARWKLAWPLAKDQRGVLSEVDFRKTRDEKVILLNRRPDVMHSKQMRMRGPNIGR